MCRGWLQAASAGARETAARPFVGGRVTKRVWGSTRRVRRSVQCASSSSGSSPDCGQLKLERLRGALPSRLPTESTEAPGTPGSPPAAAVVPAAPPGPGGGAAGTRAPLGSARSAVRWAAFLERRRSFWSTDLRAQVFRLPENSDVGCSLWHLRRGDTAARLGTAYGRSGRGAPSGAWCMRLVGVLVAMPHGLSAQTHMDALSRVVGVAQVGSPPVSGAGGGHVVGLSPAN